MNSTNFYKITYVENNKLITLDLKEKNKDFNYCLLIYKQLKEMSAVNDVKFYLVSNQEELLTDDQLPEV